MSQKAHVTGQHTEQGAVLLFDETLYPREAVLGASYCLMDRCFVHLERAGNQLCVRLRAKPGQRLSVEALAGEFENEALVQCWRAELFERNRADIEALTARALAGASGPPGLEELLAECAMGTGDGALDDPLGIAVSWEEKYGEAQNNSGESEPKEPKG